MTEEIDNIYDLARATDLLAAKALKLSEVAQIATLEAKASSYLKVKWDVRRRSAALLGSAVARDGGTASAIVAKVNKTMSLWAGDVTKIFNRENAECYRLARQAGERKASGKSKASLQYDDKDLEQLVTKAQTKFDAADDETIASLELRNTFWIGRHYDEHVAEAIAKTTKEVLAEGGDKARAGRALKQRLFEVLGTVSVPSGYRGTSNSYFEALAANAFTVARAYGQLRSFDDIGITNYVVVNPLDERTCFFCDHMDGKKFSVKDGVSQMNAELDADSPDQIKSIHPWLSLSALLKISPLKGNQSKKDSSRLSKAGLALPPYHLKCRCTIDVDIEEASFDLLE